MATQDMRHFVNGGFYGINGQGINRNHSLLAVSLAIDVDHLKGPFFDVKGFKGLCSVPRMASSIRLVFPAFILSKNKPTPFPDKECVMLRCFFSCSFILSGLLARDRHAKPDCLFSALDEPALAVPVLQCTNRPYWNLAQRALNQCGKLIAD